MENLSAQDLFEQSIKLLEDKLKHPLDEEVQNKIAILLKSAYKVKIANSSIAQTYFDIALASLLCEPPNLIVADSAIQELSDYKGASTHPMFRLFHYSPASKVILGLSTLLYLVIPSFIILKPYLGYGGLIFGIDSNLVALVSIFGSLGSIVSIMVRIHEFQENRSNNFVLYFTGFFKPIIGMSFALFVFAALKAGIIPINVNPKFETYFFIALSFVAGFSERFAQDIVSQTETRVSKSRLK